MLHLLHTYTGCPSTGLQHLVLPKETLLIYPSFDSIIILNARSLAFIRAVAFWEAFPGALYAREAIRCLSIDPGMRLIVASMGARLATWSLSGVQSDAWRVYSSLILPDGQPITTVDCKSGLLAIGTPSSLAVYTLILENDLPTWSLKWSLPIAGLSRVRFSPSLMYIASTTKSDNTVHIYLTTSGKQTQRIRHPRPVTDMNWRQAQASSRDDLILYTITSDATLRIFLPVLDAPQHLQLHAAVDIFSAVPFSVASQIESSRVFWLGREIMSGALTAALNNSAQDSEDGRRKRVREIKEENWDLFLRVLSDGSLVVQAVANIDRRPPTLLKHFTLLQSASSTLPAPPEHLYILPNPASPETLTLVSSAPVSSYILSPLSFFDAQPDGLKLSAQGDSPLSHDKTDSQTLAGLIRFVRTPDGEALGSLRDDGAVEIWIMNKNDRTPNRLTLFKPEGPHKVDRVVVLAEGRYFITYCESLASATLHSADLTLKIPPVDVKPLASLFSIAFVARDGSHNVVGISASSTITLLHATLPSVSSNNSPPARLTLHSESSLPLEVEPRMILAVDPMTWSASFSSSSQWSSDDEVLVSIGCDGELAFWSLDIGNNGAVSQAKWKCARRVRTQRHNITMAACSSAKKTVLVSPGPDGQELSIWDSIESEFSSGLEYTQTISPDNPVLDLDWTATPDNQSILAVGFAHQIDLLCQQRMTYFDETPGWATCWRIDLSRSIPHQISDSIWLTGGVLLVGTGQFMSLYGQPYTFHRTGPEGEDESLFEHVARHNGPLDDYHPQMILQCLLWEKVELVKSSFINLSRNLARTRDTHQWEPLPFEGFLRKDATAKTNLTVSQKPRYSMLFELPDAADEPDEEQFSSKLVQELVEKLEDEPLPHLTPNEQQSLLVLLQTTLEIESQRRALDANGLRYLITMRVFYIYNHKFSMPDTPASHGTIRQWPQRRERLRYRDMIWAFHSDSQDLLLAQSVAACEGRKMCWPDARSLGVFIWLRSLETAKAHMEVMARNQYMAGDNRDPTACSLFYFALGKSKLVHGLWRQAAWHKEQGAMLKFLNNNFSEPRWRTAALKNAFALLSKRRFEYAAAFFLLGGSLKDAVNVCLKNLQDFQLAIAVARVVEQGDEGPVLREILTTTVIPTAFREGNRWLASWAFWLLRRRDLAVRVLITPLRDLAAVWDNNITEIGEPHYDDPSLALLFSQLKLKTLQTAKGTSEISGRTEFKFVLQIARVFCRMGCHALALDLVRTWSFERPSTVVHDSPVLRPPPSPLAARFALEPAFRRQASIMIDMEIPTLPPTRSASPTLRAPNGILPTENDAMQQETGDLVARKAGMGRLMKSAKQDVQVPEFDMNAFF